MIRPDKDLFKLLNSHPPSMDDSASDDSKSEVELDREDQRLLTLQQLGLLDTESIPVFDEVTQTAAHLLDVPICILGLIDRDRQWFKSAVGLSRIGLMNSLATTRQLPRHESFCNQVIEHQHVLMINDAAHHPDFSHSLLVNRYGIQAYLGVPLITSDGWCIGSLAVMETVAREFTNKDVEFLELLARWSMSEFERNRLLKMHLTNLQIPDSSLSAPVSNGSTICNHPPQISSSAMTVKAELIAQMTQELRTPLTSILGMASVLNREIYGPLTEKQKKYMDVVHTSGQHMLSVVNEILELGALNECSRDLNLSPVDIEMLCQQAFSTLEQTCQRREQNIRLSIEPGRRIWLLDKEKVRQMLYHLASRVIQSSNAGGIIRIHVSRKHSQLHITVWTSHPWLGDGLPYTELYTASANSMNLIFDCHADDSLDTVEPEETGDTEDSSSSSTVSGNKTESDQTRHNLGIMLARQLAEIHGGMLTIQGSSESGHRYVLTLPQMSDRTDSSGA
jgi:signal transduction histidine kinase